MCLGGGSSDNGAEQMRQQEQERQAKVTAGTSALDKAFSGFDDNFYKNYQDTYKNYYQPQLDTQFNDARKKLILGSTGGTANSGFAERLAGLQKAYQEQSGAINSQALDASKGQQSDLETKRANILSQINAGLDAGSAATLADQQAKLFTKPPAFSPLADMFTQYVSNVNNNQAAQNNGYSGFSTPILFGRSGGAARVVNQESVCALTQ